MKKFTTLTILVAASALVVAPLAMSVPAQAAPATHVSVAKATAKANPGGHKHKHTLDAKLIRSMTSKDHTVVTSKIKIAPLLEPSATVWTSTRQRVNAVLAWEIRDRAGQGDQVRVCSEDPMASIDECATYDLAPSRGGRLGIMVQHTRDGWNVFAQPVYDPRSRQECRAEGVRGSLVTWTIEVLADGQSVASSESSWRLRCSR